MTKYTATSPLTGTAHTVTTSREIGALGFVLMIGVDGTLTELVYSSKTLDGAEKIARREFTYRTKPRPSNTQMPVERVKHAAAVALAQ